MQPLPLGCPLRTGAGSACLSPPPYAAAPLDDAGAGRIHPCGNPQCHPQTLVLLASSLLLFYAYCNPNPMHLIFFLQCIQLLQHDTNIWIFVEQKFQASQWVYFLRCPVTGRHGGTCQARSCNPVYSHVVSASQSLQYNSHRQAGLEPHLGALHVRGPLFLNACSKDTCLVSFLNLKKASIPP